MQQVKKYFTFIILALMLSACASNLDTLNKRFAAFEISYKSALVQIDSLERSNSFKPETKLKVADALVNVNKARAAAFAAKDAGDIFGAQDQLSLAIALLEQLKLLLPTGGQI